MYITVSDERKNRNKDVENLHLWQHTLLSKSTKVVSNVQSAWNSSSTLSTMVHCNIFRIINWYLHREIPPSVTIRTQWGDPLVEQWEMSLVPSIWHGYAFCGCLTELSTIFQLYLDGLVLLVLVTWVLS